jgi:DNA replication protein DnaC
MTVQQPLPELNVSLRKLGLSGMLASLESRNQQALTGQMAYCEFLSLLAQDELLMRANRSYERRCKLANLNGHKTIENFDFMFNPKINQRLIRDLATCHFIREKQSLLLIGPCGTGKTHLAEALGFCALKQEYDVICTTQSQLTASLQAARATHTYGKKLKQFATVPLLIIDDFGLKPLKTPEDEDIHEVISRRYEKGSIIITSNLAISEWQQAFPNQLLGAATLDRLQHRSEAIILEGASYRSRQITPKQEGQKGG